MNSRLAGISAGPSVPSASSTAPSRIGTASTRPASTSGRIFCQCRYENGETKSKYQRGFIQPSSVVVPAPDHARMHASLPARRRAGRRGRARGSVPVARTRMEDAVATAREVVEFWRQAGAAAWFAGDGAVDRECARLEQAHVGGARGGHEDWLQSSEGGLAL